MKSQLHPKTIFSLTLAMGAGAFLGLTACDNKTVDQKTTEAKQEAVQKINDAQAEADKKKLEAAQKAQKEIAEAQGKAVPPPPAVVPAPPVVPPPPAATPGSTVDKIENKVKDALNVRPNEGVKDALEDKAANAKDAADEAAARAEEAAQKAAEAAKKAGQ